MFVQTENKSIVIVKFNGKVYRGVAKCNPNDEFSDFTGHSIAYERALKKALKYNHKVAEKRLKYLAEQIAILERKYEKTAEWRERIEDEIYENETTLTELVKGE